MVPYACGLGHGSEAGQVEVDSAAGAGNRNESRFRQRRRRYILDGRHRPRGKTEKARIAGPNHTDRTWIVATRIVARPTVEIDAPRGHPIAGDGDRRAATGIEFASA